MKRLMILGIVACVGLLFASAAIAKNPKGPPSGLGVEIVNPLPVPVTGDLNATVSGDVNIANQPTVDAMQSGEWSVTLENDSTEPVPVTIVNTITKTHMGVPPIDLVNLKSKNRYEFYTIFLLTSY